MGMGSNIERNPKSRFVARQLGKRGYYELEGGIPEVLGFCLFVFSLSPAPRTVLVISYIDVVGTVTVKTVTWVYKTPKGKPASLARGTRKRGL